MESEGSSFAQLRDYLNFFFSPWKKDYLNFIENKSYEEGSESKTQINQKNYDEVLTFQNKKDQRSSRIIQSTSKGSSIGSLQAPVTQELPMAVPTPLLRNPLQVKSIAVP